MRYINKQIVLMAVLQLDIFEFTEPNIQLYVDRSDLIINLIILGSALFKHSELYWTV